MGYHRAPKTTQERRANGRRCNNIDEYGVRLRGRRSQMTLPDTYDDMQRSDINFHSWKRHRRTQYHGFLTNRRRKRHMGK